MRATENDEDIWTRCCRRILVRISRKLPRVAKAEVPLRSERRGVSGFSRCIQLVPGSSRWWGLMGKHVVYRERRTGNHDLRVSTRANRIGRTAGIMPRERFARGLFQFNAQLLASRLAPRFLLRRDPPGSLVGVPGLLYTCARFPLCGLVVGLSRIIPTTR